MDVHFVEMNPLGGTLPVANASGDGPIGQPRLVLDVLETTQQVVLEDRGVRGAFLSCRDGKTQQMELPLAFANIAREGATLTITVHKDVHPGCELGGKPIAWTCTGGDAEAESWRGEIEQAIEKVNAKHWGISKSFVREQQDRWESERKRCKGMTVAEYFIEIGLGHVYDDTWGWCAGALASVEAQIEKSAADLKSIAYFKSKINKTELYECMELTDYMNVLKHQDLVPAERKVAYADFIHAEVDNTGRRKVGKATVFVSHVWKMTALAFFEVCLAEMDDEDYAWIDLYLHNQYQGAVSKIGDENSQYWVNKFGELIGSIGKVIAIVTDWESPVMLTRIWCLFELHAAIDTNAKLRFVATEAESQDLALHLSDRFKYLNAIVSNIDVRECDAKRPHEIQDKKIFLSKLCGQEDEVNDKLRRQMRQWLADAAEAGLSRTVLNRPVLSGEELLRETRKTRLLERQPRLPGVLVISGISLVMMAGLVFIRGSKGDTVSNTEIKSFNVPCRNLSFCQEYMQCERDTAFYLRSQGNEPVEQLARAACNACHGKCCAVGDVVCHGHCNATVCNNTLAYCDQPRFELHPDCSNSTCRQKNELCDDVCLGLINGTSRNFVWTTTYDSSREPSTDRILLVAVFIAGVALSYLGKWLKYHQKKRQLRTLASPFGARAVQNRRVLVCALTFVVLATAILIEGILVKAMAIALLLATVLSAIDAEATAGARAEYGAQVGWLRLDLAAAIRPQNGPLASEETERAHQIFRAAHQELQSIVGTSNAQYSYIVAPGLARCLVELGRRDEAFLLFNDLKTAMQQHHEAWQGLKVPFLANTYLLKTVAFHWRQRGNLLCARMILALRHSDIDFTLSSEVLTHLKLAGETTWGERQVLDKTHPELSELLDRMKVKESSGQVPQNDMDAADYSHWLALPPLMRSAGDNPLSPWVKYTCGRQSYFKRLDPVLLRLERPAEGVCQEAEVGTRGFSIIGEPWWQGVLPIFSSREGLWASEFTECGGQVEDAELRKRNRIHNFIVRSLKLLLLSGLIAALLGMWCWAFVYIDCNDRGVWGIGSCNCGSDFAGLRCELDCGCGSHGAQTDIVAARSAADCSAGTCTCEDGYDGSECQLAPAYIISGAVDRDFNGRYQRAETDCSPFPPSLVRDTDTGTEHWMLADLSSLYRQAGTGNALVQFADGRSHRWMLGVPADCVSRVARQVIRSVTQMSPYNARDEVGGPQDTSVYWEEFMERSLATVAIDCVGAWSSCRASCDKVYTITTYQLAGGSACQAADGATLPCNDGDGACICKCADNSVVTGEFSHHGCGRGRDITHFYMEDRDWCDTQDPTCVGPDVPCVSNLFDIQVQDEHPGACDQVIASGVLSCATDMCSSCGEYRHACDRSCGYQCSLPAGSIYCSNNVTSVNAAPPPVNTSRTWAQNPFLSVTTCPTDDPCCGLDCGEHGTLERGSSGSCVCRCIDTYIGELCDINCDCGLHGTQVNITGARAAGSCNGGRCICTDGYSGVACEFAFAYIVSGATDSVYNGRYERDLSCGRVVYRRRDTICGYTSMLQGPTETATWQLGLENSPIAFSDKCTNVEDCIWQQVCVVEAGQPWLKVPNRGCPCQRGCLQRSLERSSAVISAYTTLREAKVACQTDPACLFVADDSCDGSNLWQHRYYRDRSGAYQIDPHSGERILLPPFQTCSTEGIRSAPLRNGGLSNGIGSCMYQKPANSSKYSNITVSPCPSDDPCCGISCHGTLVVGDDGECTCSACTDGYAGESCQIAPAYCIAGALDTRLNGRYERMEGTECADLPVYQQQLGGGGGPVLFRPELTTRNGRKPVVGGVSDPWLVTDFWNQPFSDCGRSIGQSIGQNVYDQLWSSAISPLDVNTRIIIPRTTRWNSPEYRPVVTECGMSSSCPSARELSFVTCLWANRSWTAAAAGGVMRTHPRSLRNPYNAFFECGSIPGLGHPDDRGMIRRRRSAWDDPAQALTIAACPLETPCQGLEDYCGEHGTLVGGRDGKPCGCSCNGDYTGATCNLRCHCGGGGCSSSSCSTCTDGYVGEFCQLAPAFIVSGAYRPIAQFHSLTEDGFQGGGRISSSPYDGRYERMAGIECNGKPVYIKESLHDQWVGVRGSFPGSLPAQLRLFQPINSSHWEIGDDLGQCSSMRTQITSYDGGGSCALSPADGGCAGSWVEQLPPFQDVVCTEQPTEGRPSTHQRPGMSNRWCVSRVLTVATCPDDNPCCEMDCGAHGTALQDSDGFCTCRCIDNYVGSRCQWTCGDHGTSTGALTCVCDDNYVGNPTGPRQCRDSCGDNGTSTDGLTCICDHGFVGDLCQFSCDDHGTSSSTNYCHCRDGYTGQNCAANCGLGINCWQSATRLGETCDAVCEANGLTCRAGDWGVHDAASMRFALMAAGLNPDAVCEKGFRFRNGVWRTGPVYAWRLETHAPSHDFECLDVFRDESAVSDCHTAPSAGDFVYRLCLCQIQ